MSKSKNINIPAILKHTEFVFSMLEENFNCAEFIDTWISFVRNPQMTGLRNVEILLRVKLHGEVYSKSHYEDGEEISTSPIVAIEKIRGPELNTLERFYVRVCWWKRIPMSYRFITESGSVYIVSMANFAKETYGLMNAARYGAADEMVFRRGFV